MGAPGHRLHPPTPRGGKCRVRVWHPDEEQDAPVVVCTELPTNEGSSITYASEQLAAEVIRYHRLPTPVVWIEHHPPLATDGDTERTAWRTPRSRLGYRHRTRRACARKEGDVTEEERSTGIRREDVDHLGLVRFEGRPAQLSDAWMDNYGGTESWILTLDCEGARFRLSGYFRGDVFVEEDRVRLG